MRSMYRLFPALCVAALLAGPAAPARAAGPAKAEVTNGPKATLQRLNGSVDKLLRKKVAAGSPEEEQVKTEVKMRASELLDYAELARRALLDHWDKLTKKQRTDFVTTFQDLIERNYVKQLRTNLNYEVTYGEQEIDDDGKEAKVTTNIKIQTKGKPTEALIEYRMIKNGARWMVYDVITDELSLVRNYRSQFQRIIAGQGYDGLIQRMKKKLAESQG